jgi:hypothetical protein
VRGSHTGRTGLFVAPAAGGVLGAPTYLGGPGADLTVADVNNDDRLDISTIGDGMIDIFTGNAAGSLALATSIAAGYDGFSIASGRITGSKAVDLIELDDTNPAQVTVYENQARR